MFRKFTLLLAALATLLVAVPALANASTGLTTSKGLLVPVGTQFTINGAGPEILFAYALGGETRCEPPLYFNAVLSKNTATEGMEASGSIRAWGICAIHRERKGFELSSLISSPTEAGKGKANIGFSVEINGGGYCHWSSKEAPFSYTSGTDKITFTKVTLAGTPAGCGNAQWSAQYTLETKEGVPLSLM